MYPKTHFLSEIASGEPIPANKRAYFHRRTLNNFYDFIVAKFLEKEAQGFTKADLARRIGKGPDQISRWLGAPGNWTLETISDLLLGIGAEEIVPQSTSVLDRRPRNYRAQEWLEFPGSVSFPSSKTPTFSNTTSSYEVSFSP